MTYRMTFRGAPVPAEPGQSVGAALVAAGIRDWRAAGDRSRPLGLFCGIGVCFGCLITIDGTSGERACLVPAADGMRLGEGADAAAGDHARTGPGDEEDGDAAHP